MSQLPGSIKKASFLQLAFMIYGAACAGAFGLEDMISDAGPGVALITLALMPFLFSVPVSFATAELTTAFPVEGGNYRWSRMALGDFWGFQAGWWAWMTGVVTNSLFAVLFANYLKYWWPEMSALQHWLSAVTLIWLLNYLNVRGIEVVGRSAILLSIILLIPFAIMLVIGIANWQHNPFSPFVVPGKTAVAGFGSAIVLAIWLYSGYDKLSAATEEVENPQHNFPPALFLAATMAMLSYLLPTLAGLAAQGDWEKWSGAYFSTIAGDMGGPWLGHAMTIGALCSNALLLNVTMLSTSRLPFTIAQDGFLPRFLANRHLRFGTPTPALFWCSITYSLLSLFDFTQLTIIYAWFQMSSYILLYINVWVMRRTHAETPRPFKIPFGKPGLFLAMFPTCFFALVAIASTVYEDSQFIWKQVLIGALALLSGPIVYLIVTLLKKQTRLGKHFEKETAMPLRGGRETT